MKKIILKSKAEISDNKELEILKKAAKKSSENAVKESRILGLTIKLILNNNLVEKSPNGEIKILRKIDKVFSTEKGLKKGDVLCRK